MSRPDLIFYSQYFYPEAGATSELLSALAAELSGRGISVGAVAGQPSYFSTQKVAARMRMGGVDVRRVWSTQFSRHSMLGRAVNAVTFACSAFFHSLVFGRGSLSVCVTNPPLLPISLLLSHIVAGRRYSVLIHDVYPDIAVELGALKRGGLIELVWRWSNALAYSRASRIIVLGRDMEALVAAKLKPANRAKIELIPNWADPRQIRPKGRSDESVHAFLRAARVEADFVVQYSGNIGRFHEVETILEAAARLQHDSSTAFLFIGTGAQAPLVVEEAARENSNVIAIGPQPRSCLSTSLSACDVSLVTLRSGLEGMAVPSKLYGILAVGRPVVVVAPPESEAARAVVEGACGVVVRPGDAEGLVAAVTRLKLDRAWREQLGANARLMFQERYTLSAVADRWERLIRAEAQR